MCGSLLGIGRIGPLINPNCLSNLTPQSGAAHFHSKSLMPAEKWEKLTLGVIFCLDLSVIKVVQALAGIMRFCGATLTNHLIPTQRVIDPCCFNQVRHYCGVRANVGLKNCEHYTRFTKWGIRAAAWPGKICNPANNSSEVDVLIHLEGRHAWMKEAGRNVQAK